MDAAEGTATATDKAGGRNRPLLLISNPDRRDRPGFFSGRRIRPSSRADCRTSQRPSLLVSLTPRIALSHPGIMSDPRILVTLCTYNERDNIARLVPQIRQVLPEADVLVIDDNSPDGTGRVADELAAADGRIRVLHRPGKAGLGAAMLAGFRHAISHGYDFVLNMDADFSHDPRHLRALVECMQRADVAIGSRYVPGGGIDGWGFGRHFMSRGINWYADSSWGFRPATIAALIAAIGWRNWHKSTSISCGRAATRSRKRSFTAAATSGAALRRRRSGSMIVAMATRRSTGASRRRPCGSFSAWGSRISSAEGSGPAKTGSPVKREAPDGNRTRTRSLGSCRDTISPRAPATKSRAASLNLLAAGKAGQAAASPRICQPAAAKR